MTTIAITEKDGVHQEWYKEAKRQTLESLPAFLRHLTEDYIHDYGTICHALAAAAIAAAAALEHSPQGGISGFQGGAVMWGFIGHWIGKEDQPLRLLDYEQMLFPQYEETFTTISPSTWEWLQNEAQKHLTSIDPLTASRVEAHWRSIAVGVVPFGYMVRKD